MHVSTQGISTYLSIYIYKVIILQGGWKAKRTIPLWLTLSVTQGVTLSFICKGWWGADAVCNVLLCAKQWVWRESSAKDYILRPSSHFLCLHSLSGQMSLWGLTLPTEVKVKGIPEIFELSSNDDLVANVFWLHMTLRHPSFPLPKEVGFAASQLLKPYSIFKSSSWSFSSRIIPDAYIPFIQS